MNETIAATAGPRRVVLLAKSQKIAHQAGYYLLNGRWHKAAEHKPAPKGVPVAAHPKAAGHYVPIKHFTDGEWDQLKLPSSNSNAGTFNAQLEKLKQYSEAGDVTAILGMQVGTNTYGKKLALIANSLLEQHGAEHKVAPGQKAGEHDAVKVAPVEAAAPVVEPEPAPAPNIESPAPNITEEAPSTTLSMPTFAEGKTTKGVQKHYEAKAKKVMRLAAANDVAGLVSLHEEGLKPNSKGKVGNTWTGKTPNSKALLELHAAALEKVGGKVAAVMEANPPAPEPTKAEKVKQATAAATASLADDPEHMAAVAIANAKVAANNGLLSQIPWDKLSSPEAKGDGTPNKEGINANKKLAVIKMAAEEGDVAALKEMKFGVNTYGKKLNQAVAIAIAAIEEGTPAPAPASAQPAEEGPKDGDTKAGADGGTLVFKDGRWHAQEQAAAEPAQPELTYEEKAAKVAAYLTSTEADEHLHAEGKAIFADLPEETKHALNLAAINSQAKAEVEAAAAHPIDAVPLPDLTGLKPNAQKMVSDALTFLQAKVKAEGVSALKGIAKKMNASGKLIIKLPVSDTQGIKLSGSMAASAAANVYDYIESLKSAVGPAKKATKPKPTATTSAPHADQNVIPAMDDWKQVGPQAGSNPGGKYTDADGTEWYCKFPADADVAKSEVLAAKLYAAAGIAGQDAMLVTKDGKLGIASKWQEVKKATPSELANVDGVASGFATDAWLGNWDVVGMEFDNLQVDAATGKAMRVDAGGSLQYRAQGGKKAFGNVVSELDSLRDKAINPQAAKVFGHLSNADITAGVAKVLKVSDAQIYALVNTYGPGDSAHKKALAETLIARKADLLAKFPKAKKEKKHTFKPEKISEPPSFLNWGGTGASGPSSKQFLNEANEKAVQSIYEAAKTGSVDAIKNLSADTYNKATGEVTGVAPVLEHPSQHVKGYAQQAVNEITQQLNPPKRFRFEGGHPLHSLNAAYPSHKGPPHSDAVEKAGKFLVLGDPGTISLDSLALPKKTFASGQLTRATYSPVAKAAIAQMPETQKQAVKSYTGSSYQGMNSSLWSGNPSGAAKAAGEALHALGHDIAPGTILSRKLSVSGEGLDQILKSTGKVLQEPAIMSTSIRPSSWSGNVQLKLHVGPGVKGLWVGKGSLGAGSALSLNSSEDELILPPNTRLLILSVKKSNGGDADGFGAGSSHVIEAVILPTQQATT
uniref:Uncharacterized protein n=1 Tax=Pseudomonas phage Touem01 TaxID=3138548 RepID=A0AAU6W243_9VIRU